MACQLYCQTVSTQAKSGLLLTSSVVRTIQLFVLTMQLLWLTVHTQAKSGLLLTSSIVKGCC